MKSNLSRCVRSEVAQRVRQWRSRHSDVTEDGAKSNVSRMESQVGRNRTWIRAFDAGECSEDVGIAAFSLTSLKAELSPRMFLCEKKSKVIRSERNSMHSMPTRMATTNMVA